jgi:hypothetical protein
VDKKTKATVVSSLMALSLVLAMMAIFNNSWLAETNEDSGETTSSGLENSMIVNSYKNNTECEATKDMMVGFGVPGEISCDGKELTVLMNIEELCEPEEEGEMTENCEDVLAANSMGSTGMWAGAACALLLSVQFILPKFGLGVLDDLPIAVQTIISWSVGALMLIGVISWYVLLPEGDASASIGLYLAIIASVVGFSGAAVGQFVATED